MLSSLLRESTFAISSASGTHPLRGGKWSYPLMPTMRARFEIVMMSALLGLRDFGLKTIWFRLGAHAEAVLSRGNTAGWQLKAQFTPGDRYSRLRPNCLSRTVKLYVVVAGNLVSQIDIHSYSFRPRFDIGCRLAYIPRPAEALPKLQNHRRCHVQLVFQAFRTLAFVGELVLKLFLAFAAGLELRSQPVADYERI